MNKISRKGFLKIAAAAAMSGVTAGALAACNAASSSTAASSGAAGSYTPGTYTGTAEGISSTAEVGLYEQISRLNNHRPFRLPPMRAATLNFFGTLSGSYELRFRLRQSRCLDNHCPAPAGFPRCYGSR